LFGSSGSLNPPDTACEFFPSPVSCLSLTKQSSQLLAERFPTMITTAEMVAQLHESGGELEGAHPIFSL
jgi:hypothetical protein